MDGHLETHCESCGQELPSETDDATWLRQPGDASEARKTSAPVGKTAGASRDRRVLTGIAGLVVLWIAVVLVGRLVAPQAETGDDPGVAEQAAVTEPDGPVTEESQAETAAQLPTNEDLTDPDLPDQHNFATRRIAMNNVQVDRMKRHLARRGSSPTIAYRSADGVAFVHLGRGVAEEAALLDEGVIEAGQQILRTGGATVAIDPDTLVAATVADSAGLVVTQARDGATYFVDRDVREGSQPVIETSADGETVARVLTPLGHQLVTFDGLGLVAVSKGPASGTQLATVDSFEQLSENLVLEAHDDAMLEQVCESPVVCKLVVTNFTTGEQWDVPPRFGRIGDTYHLAPDGGSLLRVTPEGFAEIYIASEQAVAWVIGQGMRAPAWGSQSNYIVWLDLVGEATVQLMFVDDRDWLSIDLSALNAPAPTGPQFVIFEDAQPSAAQP